VWVAYGGLDFELKMGVVLCWGIYGTLYFGLKMGVGVLKKSKNDKKKHFLTKKRRKNAQKDEKTNKKRKNDSFYCVFL